MPASPGPELDDELGVEALIEGPDDPKDKDYEGGSEDGSGEDVAGPSK